jgi:hypothetical protein
MLLRRMDAAITARQLTAARILAREQLKDDNSSALQLD